MRYTIDSSEMELSWSLGEADAGARVRELWAAGVHPQFRSAAHVLELDGVVLVRGATTPAGTSSCAARTRLRRSSTISG